MFPAAPAFYRGFISLCAGFPQPLREGISCGIVNPDRLRIMMWINQEAAFRLRQQDIPVLSAGERLIDAEPAYKKTSRHFLRTGWFSPYPQGSRKPWHIWV